MPEQVFKLATLDQARSAALRWLEERSPMFGPHRKMEIMRLGTLQGSQLVLREITDASWQIRLDYDAQRLAHFNVTHGRGMMRRRAAFCFPGSAELIAAIAQGRSAN